MAERRKQRQRGASQAAVIIVIIVVLVAVFVFVLPEFAHPHMTAPFTACQSNLRSIGTAMAAYREENDGQMPVFRARPMVSDAAVNEAPSGGSDNEFGERREDGTYEDWSALNDQAMQNVWLLVMADAVGEGMFKCPADEDWVERPADAPKYGWSSPYQYSYSMQWPYSQDAEGNTNPARLGSPSTIMMADFNPGGPVSESRRPSNHPKNGLNVALASGGADKHTDTTSSTAGFDNDEIYANAAGEVGGLPQHRKDTSITLSGREVD
jgi:hypothetical protein